jgi:hypothetical protein
VCLLLLTSSDQFLLLDQVGYYFVKVNTDCCVIYMEVSQNNFNVICHVVKKLELLYLLLSRIFGEMKENVFKLLGSSYDKLIFDLFLSS